ncbi:MAG TPA: hypothetical protein VLG67_04170 [Candidatus Saccharimonadales bacterium]|nr:hypothetical protein [Candidatus Saccharimonadales bacterium]
MNWFKKRNNQIITGVVVVLLLISGFLIFGKKSKTVQQDTTQDQTVQKLSAEDLGLIITPKPDKKAIKFSISKASDIKSIEYELTYEADSTAQEISEGGEARVQRGITGDAKIDSGKGSYESEWLDLGSCSKNICRYDTGVKSVSLTLKIVKQDGKVYQSEKSLDL